MHNCSIAVIKCISIHAPARGASTGMRRQEVIPLFQFTPLREGLRKEHGNWLKRQGYFNSRPCERGFKSFTLSVLDEVDFNSRPCERGFKAQTERLSAEPFQFTPLREGLRTYTDEQLEAMQFQFTPLREGLQQSHS